MLDQPIKSTAHLQSRQTIQSQQHTPFQSPRPNLKTVHCRRSQVEERKRMIWEAERERREAILRKNQEREARIEAKRKNERSHIVFAFGSSTPRMLEPADTGGAAAGYWGTRRATSTTNVMMFSAAQPLTRRSSERELDGSKKRATSAGGLDRKPGEGQCCRRAYRCSFCRYCGICIYGISVVVFIVYLFSRWMFR